jgi:hypothetical protein
LQNIKEVAINYSTPLLCTVFETHNFHHKHLPKQNIKQIKCRSDMRIFQ